MPIGLQERFRDLREDMLDIERHSAAEIEQSTRLKSIRGSFIKGLSFTGTCKIDTFLVLLCNF